MDKSMAKTKSLSKQTRNNWLIDSVLLIGAVVSMLTGIYFLFLPVGGYQGGRNPMYGVIILFERETWDDLHTWFGIAMIVAAVIHIVIHWKWIVNMTRRAIQEITRRERRFNSRSRFNVGINMLIGLSFLITAISGIYLLFVTSGRNGITDPMIIFNRTTWDMIHTWAGVVMINAAVIHFTIHWGWVVKVTGKMFRSRAISSREISVKTSEV
jgi:hypothetical protein